MVGGGSHLLPVVWMAVQLLHASSDYVVREIVAERNRECACAAPRPHRLSAAAELHWHTGVRQAGARRRLTDHKSHSCHRRCPEQRPSTVSTLHCLANTGRQREKEGSHLGQWP